MRLQNTYLTAVILTLVFFTLSAGAQSKAYKRSQPAPAKVAPADSSKTGTVVPVATAPKKESEKLDIQELEQKYWAPKDTDFTVVQNRTYTKAKRVAASLMTGPVVNDPFNEGLTTALSLNYYLDERYGFELMYQTSNQVDSDATTSFTKFASGVRPDFNRDDSFYGVGFNWVPFYAKMSFLGKKIIYFDMQITPFVGMTSYLQQSEVKNPTESAFAYGLDVTQFFFFSKNWAVRANLHNRFYNSDVLAYKTGGGLSSGDVRRSGESTTSTMFLMGVTYFF